MGLKLAQKKENQDAFIQLPWAVPQQSVQTLVIQQPTKTHMELNASTDKTAISSFALSVIVALILGGFATWLAYWYGRKSFKLTEMSFKTVVEQIRASEKSALDLNNKLFEQQTILQNNKLQYVYKTSEIEKLRTIITAYLTCLLDFNTSITMKIKKIERQELIEECVQYNLRVANYHQQIELFLDCENNEFDRNIKSKLKNLINVLWDIRKDLENNENSINEKIANYSIAYDGISTLLNQYVVKEVRKLKGE